MPRTDLTLADKIDLLDTIKDHPPNISHRMLAVSTGVPKSTLSRIRRQEPQLRAEWSSQKGKPPRCKRKREGKDPQVEAELLKWYKEQGEYIRGPTLKSKAVEIACQMGHDDFKATCGWLSRFRARHKLKKHKDQEEFQISAFPNDCEEEDDDEEEDRSVVPVTPREAKRFITGLRRFFTQDGNEGSPVSALSVCADFVEMELQKSKKLAKFNEFLKT